MQFKIRALYSFGCSMSYKHVKGCDLSEVILECVVLKTRDTFLNLRNQPILQRDVTMTVCTHSCCKYCCQLIHRVLYDNGELFVRFDIFKISELRFPYYWEVENLLWEMLLR